MAGKLASHAHRQLDRQRAPLWSPPRRGSISSRSIFPVALFILIAFSISQRYVTSQRLPPSASSSNPIPGTSLSENARSSNLQSEVTHRGRELGYMWPFSLLSSTSSAQDTSQSSRKRYIQRCDTRTGAGCTPGDHHYVDPRFGNTQSKNKSTADSGWFHTAQAEAAGTPGKRSLSRSHTIDALVVSSYSARSVSQLQTLIRVSTASLQLALQKVPTVVPFCRAPLTEAIRRSKLVSNQLSRRAIFMARKEVAQVARAVAVCQSRLGVTMRNRKSTSTSDREAYTVGFRELENTMIRLSGVGTVLQKQIAAYTQSGKLTVTAVGSMTDRTVDLFPDYGADLMRQLPGSVTTLTFNGTLGARIHSAFTYPSGVFTAKLMCAKGDTRGLDTTFYLSSIEGGPGTDSILMSIFGNDRTRVRCLTLVDGESGLTHEVEVGNDCAAGYHTISIMWSGRLIVWKYDDLILRVSSRNMLSPFPVSTTMYLYASIYDTAKYSYAWQAGYLTNADAPYVVSYKDTSAVVPAPSYNFGLPLDLTNGASVPRSAIGRGPLWPIAIDYCSDHVVTLKGYQSITFDDKGCGGRFHSTVRHYSGVFTAFVQCPAGNTSGLVSAFYLSSEEGNKEQDEIDFEWLGKDKTAVQTNFYVNGKGGREVLVPLGFDCSKGFHNYTLLWTTNRLQWFIDNKMVRDVQRAQADAWPVKPMFAYASMWNASSISNGWWSGTWSGKDIPYVIKFKDIKIGNA